MSHGRVLSEDGRSLYPLTFHDTWPQMPEDGRSLSTDITWRMAVYVREVADYLLSELEARTPYV